MAAPILPGILPGLAALGQNPAGQVPLPPTATPYPTGAMPQTPSVLPFAGGQAGTPNSPFAAGYAVNTPMAGVYDTPVPMNFPQVTGLDVANHIRQLQQASGNGLTQNTPNPALQAAIEQNAVSQILQSRGITDPAVFSPGEKWGVNDLAQYHKVDTSGKSTTDTHAGVPLGSIYQEGVSKDGAFVPSGVFKRKMSTTSPQADPQVYAPGGIGNDISGEVSGGANQVLGGLDKTIASALRAFGAKQAAQSYADTGERREQAAQVQGKIGAAVGEAAPILAALASIPATGGADLPVVGGALAGRYGIPLLGGLLAGGQGAAESGGTGIANRESAGQVLGDELTGGLGSGIMGMLTPNAGRTLFNLGANALGREGVAAAASGPVRNALEGAATFGIGNTGVQAAQAAMNPNFAMPSSGSVLGNAAFGGALGLLHSRGLPATGETAADAANAAEPTEAPTPTPAPLEPASDTTPTPPTEPAPADTPAPAPTVSPEGATAPEGTPDATIPPADATAEPINPETPATVDTPEGATQAEGETPPTPADGADAAAQEPTQPETPPAPTEVTIPPLRESNPLTVRRGLERMSQTYTDSATALHDLLNGRNISPDATYVDNRPVSAVTPYMAPTDLNGKTAQQLGEQIATARAYHEIYTREARAAGIPETDIPKIPPLPHDVQQQIRKYVPQPQIEWSPQDAEGRSTGAKVRLLDNGTAPLGEDATPEQIRNKVLTDSGLPIGEPTPIPSTVMDTLSKRERDTLATEERVHKAWQSPTARYSSEYILRASDTMDRQPDDVLEKIAKEGDTPNARADQIILGARARAVLEGRRMGESEVPDRAIVKECL